MHVLFALSPGAWWQRRPALLSRGRCSLSPGPAGSRALSQVWRRKQDHFARDAKAQGLRSRAAFKLQQINDQTKILKPGMVVVDLGSAPGGWTVVAAKLVNAHPETPWLPPLASVRASEAPSSTPDSYAQEMLVHDRPAGGVAELSDQASASSRQGEAKTGAEGRPKGRGGKLQGRLGKVVACDLLAMERVKGAMFVQGDFTDELVQAQVLSVINAGGQERGDLRRGSCGVDVVLSDMAPNTSGNASRDHAIIVGLARSALCFAESTLAPGGTLRHYYVKLALHAEACQASHQKNLLAEHRCSDDTSTPACLFHCVFVFVPLS